MEKGLKLVEDSQVSSLMLGLQGVVLFQEGFFFFWHLWRMSLLICTWSPFEVCMYVCWSPFGVCTYLYVLAAPLTYVITCLRSHVAQTKS